MGKKSSMVTFQCMQISSPIETLVQDVSRDWFHSFVSLRIRCLVFLMLGFLQLAYAQQQKVNARFIIIGDAGKLRDGENSVVNAATRYISPTDSNTTVLFLGDNIYPKGLPDEGSKTYTSSVHVLETILAPFKDYRAKVYVVPGNHDWQKGGPDGWQSIKRQGQVVKALRQPNTFFLPAEGCPGPEEVVINDEVVLVIMDTQWWLHSGDKPGMDDDCDCKNEEEILARLRDITYRNRGRKILFASHHPLRSHGPHGGYYTWKQHVFPLSDAYPNAYLPLPVVGSLYPLIRGTFGHLASLMHPLSKDMIGGIEKALSQAPDVTYVGGHEHNLQLIAEGNRHYIVSGSGTNRERVIKKENTLFASDENGFAEILYYAEGKQTIQFHSVDEQSNGKVLYTYQAPETDTLHTAVPLPAQLTFPDSITVKIAPEYDEVSN